MNNSRVITLTLSACLISVWVGYLIGVKSSSLELYSAKCEIELRDSVINVLISDRLREQRMVLDALSRTQHKLDKILEE